MQNEVSHDWNRTGTKLKPNGSGLVPVRFWFGSRHVTSFFARLNAALPESDLENGFWARLGTGTAGTGS